MDHESMERPEHLQQPSTPCLAANRRRKTPPYKMLLRRPRRHRQRAAAQSAQRELPREPHNSVLLARRVPTCIAVLPLPLPPSRLPVEPSALQQVPLQQACIPQLLAIPLGPWLHPQCARRAGQPGLSSRRVDICARILTSHAVRAPVPQPAPRRRHEDQAKGICGLHPCRV